LLMPFPYQFFFSLSCIIILVFNGHHWHKGKVTTYTGSVDCCGKGICLRYSSPIPNKDKAKIAFSS
jgi:hypothetical protein